MKERWLIIWVIHTTPRNRSFRLQKGLIGIRWEALSYKINIISTFNNKLIGFGSVKGLNIHGPFRSVFYQKHPFLYQKTTRTPVISDQNTRSLYQYIYRFIYQNTRFVDHNTRFSRKYQKNSYIWPKHPLYIPKHPFDIPKPPFYEYYRRGVLVILTAVLVIKRFRVW